MCGIVGAYDLEGRRSFPAALLRRMSLAVAHRGPDDDGEHHEAGLAMATRRLAIRGVDDGAQPWSSDGGRVTVAFNGELFDFPECVTTESSQARSDCDTMAWVPLYERHGADLFEHARGQFAVAIWDREQRRLLLGRDRHGICPLYYARVDGWLLWASEVKGLLASGMLQAEPDPFAIDHLFSFFSAPSQRTFFRGVSLLRPGTFLDVTDGRFVERRYWDLDFPDAGAERRESDASVLVDELQGLLEDAVDRRLRSEVPVASYVSGGVDSSLVLALANRNGNAPPRAFTIGFDAAGPDERQKSHATADLLDVPIETIVLDQTAIHAAFPALTLAAEGPVFDQSNAALLLLAEAVAASGHKVALTGEGADESFGGYIWYRIQKVLDHLSTWTAGLSPTLIRGMTGGLVGGRERRPELSPMNGTRVAQQHTYDGLGQARAHLFADGLWERLNGYDPYVDLDLPNQNMRRWAPLNQSLYVESKLMLPGHLLLAKGDRVTMNAAVEGRYPYLDEAVTDFCAALAPEYKLRGLREKWILRQVAERFLPPRIAHRQKSMFRAYPSFANGNHPAWVNQLLSPESLAATGYFDADNIQRHRSRSSVARRMSVRGYLLDACMTGVVSTQLWHHTFCGGGLCELPAWSAPLESSA